MADFEKKGDDGIVLPEVQRSHSSSVDYPNEKSRDSEMGEERLETFDDHDVYVACNSGWP